MSGVPISPFRRNEDVARLEKELSQTLAELELSKSSLLSKEMQCDAMAGRIAHQSTVSKEQISGNNNLDYKVIICIPVYIIWLLSETRTDLKAVAVEKYFLINY